MIQVSLPISRQVYANPARAQLRGNQENPVWGVRRVPHLLLGSRASPGICSQLWQENRPQHRHRHPPQRSLCFSEDIQPPQAIQLLGSSHLQPRGLLRELRGQSRLVHELIIGLLQWLQGGGCVGIFHQEKELLQSLPPLVLRSEFKNFWTWNRNKNGPSIHLHPQGNLSDLPHVWSQKFRSLWSWSWKHPQIHIS